MITQRARKSTSVACISILLDHLINTRVKKAIHFRKQCITSEVTALLTPQSVAIRTPVQMASQFLLRFTRHW